MDKTIIIGTSGIILSGILFIIFLILKLAGTIGWSWWWVTVPIWGCSAALFIFGLIVFLIFAVKLALAVINGFGH